jgi:UDP-glucose 4-epimerase
MLKNKKVIVTGGAGFIGSHLVDALIADHYRVFVYDNFSSGTKNNLNPKAKLILCDCSKEFNMEPADTVFHLSALPRIERSFDQPLETHAANVTATLRVIQAAINCGAKRLIYTSSSSVYGKIPLANLPVKEFHPTRPTSPYAAQKLMSEIYLKLAQDSGKIDTVILRLFNVYGKRMPTAGAYKLVLPIFLEAKKQNKPLTIYGDGKQTRDFTEIKDVVSALVKTMQRKKSFNGKIINIGTGKQTSIKQLASLISDKIGYIKPNPRAKWEERKKSADISVAKQELGWYPTISIEQGVKSLLEEN